MMIVSCKVEVKTLSCIELVVFFWVNDCGVVISSTLHILIISCWECDCDYNA